MRKYQEYTLLNAAPVRAIASSTDATPIVVTTSAAHGLSTGDRITIFGHTTNVAANGTWTVTVVDDDEISLDGSVGSGGGAGAAGVFAPAAKIALAEDAQFAVLTIDTDGGGDAAMTLKVVGSISEDAPDFAKAQSVTNRFEFIEIIDSNTGTPQDGDSGWTVASADDHVQFQINADALRWISVLPTAGTAGEVTVKLKLYSAE